MRKNVKQKDSRAVCNLRSAVCELRFFLTAGCWQPTKRSAVCDLRSPRRLRLRQSAQGQGTKALFYSVLTSNLKTQRSTLIIAVCNLQSTIRDPRSAICNLRSAICGLQSAIYDPRSAVCEPRSAICGLRSANCAWLSAIHLMHMDRNGTDRPPETPP
jgi:hypothetical protein